MEEDDPSLAWGSDTTIEEVAAAIQAICDGHPSSTPLRLLRENGIFMGFEVAEGGSSSSSFSSDGTSPTQRRRQ